MTMQQGLHAVLSLAVAWSLGWASVSADAGYRLASTSKVQFKCVGKEISKGAAGAFPNVRSHLKVDASNLANTRGYLNVTLSSIQTNDDTWNIFFRAAPFLNLDEFPVATFRLDKITGARALKQNQWVKLNLVGRLAIHGIEKPRKLLARARWLSASSEAPERIEVETTFDVRWKDHDIFVPSGAAERFAGTGAKVSAKLVLVR